MENCGMSCIKYLLFIFNLLFALAGVGLIVAGSLVLAYADYDLLEGQSKGPTIALIVVGVIIFITAFLGCCGAIKENHCMLISFAVILVIIFIVQLSIGITAAVYKDTFKAELRSALNDSLRHFNDDKLVRQSWDVVQKDFKCCGIDGPQDYAARSQPPPASCCPVDDEAISTADQYCTQSQVVYKTGCYEELAMLTKDGLVIITGVGIGIAFIELAGAILACFLAKNITKEAEDD